MDIHERGDMEDEPIVLDQPSSDQASVDNETSSFDDAFDEDQPLVLDEDNTNNNNSSDEQTADDADEDGTRSNSDQSDEVGDDSQSQQPDVAQMSDKERNKYFAERRIAAKESDRKFFDTIRAEVTDKFVNATDDTDSTDYDLMDPDVAEQLRAHNAQMQEVQKYVRHMEAERQIQKLESARENVALGFLQGESSIPLFNPQNKDTYNPQLHEKVQADWANQFLEVSLINGEPQVIGIQEGAPTPLEYMQEQATFYQNLLGGAAAKGQAAARKNLGRSETAGSAKADSGRVVDKSLKAFDDAFDNY